jgi:exopolysaccharide biosynthesis polyprenyl glycosylphosphotransferase
MWWRTPWLRQRWLLLNLALFDALLVVSSYNVLFWYHFDRWAGITGSVGTLSLAWLGTSYLLGRYSRPDPGQNDSHSRRLVTTLLVGTLMLCFVVVVLSWGLKLEDPRTFRSFVVPMFSMVMVASSAAQLWVTSHQSRPRRWLLVGSELELSILKKELASQPSINHVEISLCNTESPSIAPDSLCQEAVDGIAVSETASLSDSLIEALLSMRGSGGVAYNLVSWCELHLQRVPPELFSSRWLVQAEGFELQPGRWSWRVKRLGDLMIASLLLVITSPLLVIAAVAIRLEDGGPIFYRQIRTGLYGQPYWVWKLRSMVIQAERKGPQWSSNNDLRITKTGSWLRRLRIDELPQLVAVVLGEMSLIGPRPERPELEATLEAQIPHYRVRSWIRPGLSGWAQVCYPYGASVSDSRMKLSFDLYYLRNASPLLDILIFIKTIRLLVWARGACPLPGALPDRRQVS